MSEKGSPRPFDDELIRATNTAVSELMARDTLEQLDTALEPQPTGMTGIMKGSITFAPDQSKPCHCATCVVLEQDVTRLRLGNAAILHDNQRLQHEVIRLQRELDVTNHLLEGRDALLAVIPECPDHGPGCVPHAVDWVEATIKELETASATIRALETKTNLEGK